MFINVVNISIYVYIIYIYTYKKKRYIYIYLSINLSGEEFTHGVVGQPLSVLANVLHRPDETKNLATITKRKENKQKIQIT